MVAIYNEPRIVKPNALWGLNLLENIEWTLYKDDVPHTKDNIISIEDEEKKVNLSIKINIKQDLLDQENFTKSNYSLAVIYIHTLLKESIVISHEKLDNFNKEIVIPKEMESELIWDSRAEIKIIIFACDEIVEKNLSKNQLIAKQILKLSSEQNESYSKDPFWLEKKEFIEKGYPAKTCYYFTMEPSLFDSGLTDVGESISIYIAKELQPIASKNSFISGVITDLLSEIFIQGYKEFNAYENLSSDSFLAHFTRKVSKANNVAPSKLVEAAKDTSNHSRIKAYAQHFSEQTKYLAKDFNL